MEALRFIISILTGLNAGFTFNNYNHKTAYLHELLVAIAIPILWIIYIK